MASRTGGSSGATIQGLPEFRKELRRLDKSWPKELRKVHKKIADQGAMRSQSVARGMGGQQRKYASAIKGKANQREARIGITAGKSNAGANAAFWGARARYGWYGFRRYHDTGGAPQYRPWVGNAWQAASYRGGPYAINPALAQYLPRILDLYLEMLDDLSRRAFPEGRN